jgi:ribosomal protein S18 acetylase RimI-like enzyme
VETFLPHDISIRTIRESDLHAFKALRLESLREHPESFGSDYAENLREPESFWVARIKDAVDSSEGCIILADAGNKLAGLAGVRREKGVKGRHAAMIWGVYVRPKYRGQKLVDRIIAELLSWCRSNQVRIVRLSATCTGPALRCYLRCGFAVYGVSPEEIRIGDKYYDETLMWRRV